MSVGKAGSDVSVSGPHRLIQWVRTRVSTTSGYFHDTPWDGDVAFMLTGPS